MKWQKGLIALGNGGFGPGPQTPLTGRMSGW
jgi:hypothetical protein